MCEQMCTHRLLGWTLICVIEKKPKGLPRKGKVKGSQHTGGKAEGSEGRTPNRALGNCEEQTNICKNLHASMDGELTPPFLKKDFICLFLERREGREKEKHRCESETSINCLSHANQGPGPQLRHVS